MDATTNTTAGPARPVPPHPNPSAAATTSAAAVALLARDLSATIIVAGDIGAAAIEYAVAGYDILPLRGKVPAIAGGHGVKDATNDLSTVASWWSRWPNANIGIRVPAGVVVLDVDPRNGGLDTLHGIEAQHGTLTTRCSISGRQDGGRHLWFRHPGGRIRTPDHWLGVDLKTASGYVVAPPSIHPDSGLAYTWDDPEVPVAPMPAGLASALRPAPTVPTATLSAARTFSTANSGDSIADRFSSSARWSEVLTGWKIVRGDGESDGSQWRHPAATHSASASIRHGLLFVYSTTPEGFNVTTPGHPAGFTKFRAYAAIHHCGNMSAAARHLLMLEGARR